MGKLQAALDWAARGFRVFPLQVNSRDPLKDWAWTDVATSDPETIRAWWVDPVTHFERDNNIGCLTNDLIVPDVDVKKGKQGLQTFAALGMEFDTLTNRTPTGGYHLIYRGLRGRLIGGAPLGPDIDIRSYHGYFVAPGSTIDGAEYRVEIDAPVADFPEHLRAKLRSPRQRPSAPSPRPDLETPELVELAAYWLLRDAPVAVEGQNGDDTTYWVACRLRDLGLSEGTAGDLMLDEYNPRCVPPWSPEEIQSKVTNAYRYATGEPGSASPVVMFGPVAAVPQVGKMNGHGVYAFGNMLAIGTIEARPWIFGDVLMARVVTALVAAGGGGKSTFVLTLAAHLAVGKDWMGMHPWRPGRSIIYNAEDALDESSRRLNAICDAYELDRDAVRSSIALVSSDELLLRITENRPPRVNDAQVFALLEAASDPAVQLVAVDPLAEIHTANENDNMEMNYVMGVLRVVARRANCAVVAVQHTGKPPVASSVSWAGNQNASRGASAVPAAARIVLTLFPAAEQDCDAIGVPESERHLYVRLDGAKANFSAKRGRPHWLRWHEREMANSDKVGVLLEHDAVTAHEAMTQGVGEVVYDELMKRAAAALGLDEAVDAVRAASLLSAKEDRGAARRRLQRVFVAPVRVAQGCSVRLVATPQGQKLVIG